VARISGVTLSEVKAVIDFEIEDRASRASDFTVSSNSNDDCDDDSNNNNNTSNNDAALKSRIVELQKLIEALLRLLNTRFGN